MGSLGGKGLGLGLGGVLHMFLCGVQYVYRQNVEMITLPGNECFDHLPPCSSWWKPWSLDTTYRPATCAHSGQYPSCDMT